MDLVFFHFIFILFLLLFFSAVLDIPTIITSDFFFSHSIFLSSFLLWLLLHL